MIDFRDADQRLRVCGTLLSEAGLASLWSRRGPTKAAEALVADGASALPPEERGVLLAVWGLWKGEQPPLSLGELVGRAECEPLLHLLIASLYGPRAIDAWLARPRPDSYVSGAQATHTAAARLFDEARAVLAESSGDALNMNAAADACALGVRQMADYALAFGVQPIEDDEERHHKALELAVRVLGLFAKASSINAYKPREGNRHSKKRRR